MAGVVQEGVWVGAGGQVCGGDGVHGGAAAASHTGEGFTDAQQGYDDTGAVPYVLRTPEQIGQCFEGLELLNPGVVSISLWRPDPASAGEVRPVDGYGAVARKP